MRKGIIAAAGMAIVLASLGLADIISKNVGGYYTVKLNKGSWSMIGINWNAGDGQGIPLQDLFKSEDLYPGDGEWDLDHCDQIVYWDNDMQGYVSFSFVRTNETEAPVWVDAEFELATQKLMPGDAIWFYRPSQNGTLNAKIPGLVDARDEITFTFQQGYSMFASGFPKDRKVGELIAGYPGEGEWDLENCDIMVLWDNEAQGWVNYYYCDIGNGPEWLDEGFSPVNINQMLKVGQGGWYFRQEATPLVFDEPNPVN